MKQYKVWSFHTETGFVWAKSAIEAIEGYAAARGIDASKCSARVVHKGA